jgi:hypothetical protein
MFRPSRAGWVIISILVATIIVGVGCSLSVNSYQQDGQLTHLTNGNFLVLWTDCHGSCQLTGALYSADSFMSIRTYTFGKADTSSSDYSSVALPDGRFGVLYRDSNGTKEVYRHLQLFSADGQKDGVPIEIEPTGALLQDNVTLGSLRIAVEPDGLMLAIFSTSTGTYSRKEHAVYFAVLTADGEPTIGALKLADTGNVSPNARVVATGSGRYAITWSASDGVRMRMLDLKADKPSESSLVYGDLQVSNWGRQIVTDANGDFLIFGLSSEIVVQRFDSYGQAKGGPTTMDVSKCGLIQGFDVAALDDGHTIIAVGCEDGEVDNSIMVQEFTSDGVSVGAPTLVTNSASPFEQNPEIAPFDGTRFVLTRTTWDGEGLPGTRVTSHLVDRPVAQ